MADSNDNNGDKMFEFEEGEDVPTSPRDARKDDITGSPRDSPRDKKSREESDNSSQPSNSRTPPFMVAASPPTFVSMSEIMQAADGVSNMVLAHEIAVDPDFRFQKQQLPSNSLEHRVTEMMHKAFFDLLQAQLNEQPPNYTQAFELLQEVKQKLVGILLPQHTKIKEEIEEVIDLDLIKQQVEHGALDFKHYADFVISIMAKLCAPARDEQVDNLRQITDIVPLYKSILETIDVLKMDMANYTLQHMRPYLQQHSIDYERNKFQEFLDKQKESGVDGLECTKSWLERSALQLFEPQGTEAGAASAAVTVTPFTILNAAYIELLEWPDNLIFPETVVMDQSRFLILEKKCHWLSLVTSVLLVTYNTVGAPIAGVAGLKEKLMEQITVLLRGVSESGLEEAMNGVSVQINKVVNESLETHGYKPLDEQRQGLLQAQIQAVRTTEHTVHKLMQSRVKRFLQDLLSTSKPTESRIPPGFTAVAKELSHVGGQFLRLVSHNRSVFGQCYANIIKEILQNHHQTEGTAV